MSQPGGSGPSPTWDLGARARRLARRDGFHAGGPSETFERDGRLQFIALVRRGLMPDDHVIDVGCGSLRAGYWLIHFLDRGRYHGIEPMGATLDIARAELLEPGLEEAKGAEFRTNDDFDLSVFGVAPRFVLARSIWSHAAKPQISALLQSFATVAAPDGLLLASYLSTRARRPDQHHEGLRARFANRARSGRPDGGRSRPDYSGARWAGWGPGTSDEIGVLVAHSFEWIKGECELQGLAVREAETDNFSGQTWLEITRVH